MQKNKKTEIEKLSLWHRLNLDEKQELVLYFMKAASLAELKKDKIKHELIGLQQFLNVEDTKQFNQFDIDMVKEIIDKLVLELKNEA